MKTDYQHYKVIALNALALAFTQGINIVVPFILLTFLARHLGVTAFGTYAFALSFISMLTLFIDYGFNISATAQIAQNQKNVALVSQLFADIVTAKAALSFLAIGGMWLLASTVPQLASLVQLLPALSITIASTALYTPWAFQGSERLGIGSNVSVIPKLATLPLFLIFIRTDQDLTAAIALNAMTGVLTSILSVFAIWRSGIVAFCRPNLEGVIRLLKEGRGIFVSTLMVSLFTTSNAFLLGLMTSAADVATYTAADKIRQAVSGLISPLSNATFPRLSSLISEHGSTHFPLYRKLFTLQLSFGTMLAAILFLTAPQLVEFVFGAHYEKATVLVQTFSISIPFIAISNYLGVQTMIPLGLSRDFSFCLCVGAIVFATTVWPLVTLLDSLGLVIAVVMTEVLISLLMYLRVRGRLYAS